MSRDIMLTRHSDLDLDFKVVVRKLYPRFSAREWGQHSSDRSVSYLCFIDLYDRFHMDHQDTQNSHPHRLHVSHTSTTVYKST